MDTGDLQKILVVGDVEGHFLQLYARVNQVIKKNGKFDMLFCVGDFFGKTTPTEWDNFVLDNTNLPVQTYILGPLDSNQEQLYQSFIGGNLHSQIHYLGKVGIFDCASKLKIAYLSGTDSGKGDCGFSSNDVDKLCLLANNNAVDILLTSQWPSGVTKFSSTPIGQILSNSSLVSKLAFNLKPRYHFAALNNCYYERHPYRNHILLNINSTPLQPTRFISLAKVAQGKNAKWLYAFAIQPISTMKSSEKIKYPDYVTECPYNPKLFALKAEKAPESKQFFFDTNTDTEQNYHSKKRKFNSEYEPQRKFQKGNCWFCLKSPDLEKHLVLSIGTHSYLSLAKGGLTPDHLLILPIDHNQTILDVSKECYQEILSYKAALEKYFDSIGKFVVFFERNYKSTHLQIQAVPLPDKLLPKIKQSFVEIGASRSLNFTEIPSEKDLKSIIPDNTFYFYVEFVKIKLFHHIKKGFPLQFGREILCSPALLNSTDKVEWKTCVVSIEQETKYVKDFKENFKKFDFTLDEEEDDSL